MFANLQFLIVLGSLVLLLVAATVAILLWRMIGAAWERRVSARREIFEALFADLWSDQIHRRFAALLVLKRLVRGKGSRGAVSSAVVSFIRERLSSTDKSPERSFEDVRLALGILASRSLGSRLNLRRHSVDLTGINFRGAPLFGIDLRSFRLLQCDFSGCLAMGANFRNCDLAGTSFNSADLKGADFRRTDLSDAVFANVDFTGARLEGARMVGTNISGAILVNARGLTQEQLDLAFGDAGTAVPEQFRFVPMKSQRSSVRLRSVIDVD